MAKVTVTVEETLVTTLTIDVPDDCDTYTILRKLYRSGQLDTSDSELQNAVAAWDGSGDEDSPWVQI